MKGKERDGLLVFNWLIDHRFRTGLHLWRMKHSIVHLYSQPVSTSEPCRPIRVFD